MDDREEEVLLARMRAAVVDAIDAHWAETNKSAIQARAAVEKARKKGIKGEKDQWVENYTVQVRHFFAGVGRAADITTPGSKRKYTIRQRPDYSFYPTRGKQLWSVTMRDETVTIALEDSKQFESAIQQCVVALLGHVYYNGE